MSTDQRLFAATVLKAFDDRGLDTDDQVRSAGGPSNTTMTLLRKVARGQEDMSEPRSDTLQRIERAAGWVRGTARDLWRGNWNPEQVHSLDDEAVQHVTGLALRYVASAAERALEGRADDAVRDLLRTHEAIETSLWREVLHTRPTAKEGIPEWNRHQAGPGEPGR